MFDDQQPNSNIVEVELPTIPLDPIPVGMNGAVGVDGCGRLMIAWTVDGFPSGDPFLPNDDSIVIHRILPNGVLSGPVESLTADQPDPPISSKGEANLNPSIAVSPTGNVRVAWIADCENCRTGQPNSTFNVTGLAQRTDFAFDQTPPVTLAPYPEIDYDHADPSAGRNDTGTGRTAWSSQGQGTLGLLQGTSFLSPNQIKCCGAVCPPEEINNLCFVAKWKPALAMRPNGDFCVAWAKAEDPLIQQTTFNIALRVYDSLGNLVDEIAGPTDADWVNDPASELTDSDQLSPAVAFDSQGNIVVTWAGSDQGFNLRIFARRFQWAGGASLIEARSVPFIVDNDATPGVSPVNLIDAHPAVALVQDSTAFPALNPGRFIIAWNSLAPGGVDSEVRAQYFDSDGRPMGREFRVNQATGDTGLNGLNIRALAESSRHTVAYGGAGHVAVTWTACDGDALFGNDCSLGTNVHYTLFPVGHAEFIDSQNPCCKGDADGNAIVDGRDIQDFVDLWLSPPAAFDIFQSCAFDMNNDAALTIDDVPCFVDALIAGACQSCAQSAGSRGGPPESDCNANGVPDATDIFLGTSQDCNANFIPDECDVDPADPDGDGLTSNDLNTNGIPDECEPDCNSNGIPDDKDIADATSADLNANGIPDECDSDCNDNGIPDEMDIDPADPDGNGVVSPDCNGNGEPDECEEDCNANGVPDDCDIDPTDPDGNGQVSPDCNGNGWPDACDMALLPPFGSLDCNANGIPDECDIASGTSQDCNANGFPDECDIASGISQDANSNGIPDECEAQQSQGGGGSGPAETTGGSSPPYEPPAAPTSPLSESEAQRAYAEFYNWCLTQRWGPNAPMPCNQQFQAMIDKMRELGLPLEAP